MQYHIQTAPIWDAFRAGDDCPVCKLYASAEERAVRRFTGEGVMEPSQRVKVNRLGFCRRHAEKLYDGGNKLGVALQFNTHTDVAIGRIDDAKNAKQAARLADKLEKSMSTCVICSELDEIMDRYMYTIAQMFACEKEFPALLAESYGFCMPHFIELLRRANKAGSASERYVASLVAREKATLRKLNGELERFTLRFDYRSADRSGKSNDDALMRSINALNGHIIDK